MSTSGKMPPVMDALHISAIVSANNGRARLTSQVGAGSSEQCLAGEQLMIFVNLGGCHHPHSRQNTVSSFLDDRWRCAGCCGTNHVDFVLEIVSEVVGGVS